VSILQLRNCINECMLLFLESSTYFVVDDLILVVRIFSRNIRAANASFLFMKILVVCA
jgi:hypothetical protein